MFEKFSGTHHGFSGTFRWSSEKDKLLLREVRYIEPYKFKHGTNESGQAWNEVANGVNQHKGFQVMPRDQRSVRDRFNKLLADFKAKVRKEEGESGTNPEPFAEAETILEEIDEQILSAKVDLASATAKDSEQQKNERKKAMAIRDAVMSTWAKSKFVADSDEEESASVKPRSRKRRRGSDALQYLEAKCQVDAEVKEQEVALRQQELALHRSDRSSLKPKCFSNSSTYSNKRCNNNSSLISNNSSLNKHKV